MNNQKQGSGLGIAAVIVAVVFILGMAVYGLMHLSSGRGGTSNADEIILQSDLQANTFLQAKTEFLLGGSAGSGGSYATASMRSERPAIGSCAGSATSTQFAVQNPYSATSTFDVQITGTNSASSTAFKVGTSTSAFPNNTASNLSPTLINATIASSSAFAIWSGITVGGTGSAGSGTGTFIKIVVGPSEWVDGYATSTYSTGIQVGVTSCSYKGVWQN